METWVLAELSDILVDIGKDSYKNIMGRIKLFRIKKKLKKAIVNEILNKYGNRPFYNELDNFLSIYKVIHTAISNCESVPIDQYKSKSNIIHYYVQLFIERFPHYICYKSEIYSMIQRCFEVIFNTLNDTSFDETARAIANISKELAGELSIELKEIKYELSDINNKISTLLTQNDNKKGIKSYILLEQYFEYLTRLYLDLKKDANFIPRSLYSKKKENDEDIEEKELDSLEALLLHKQILLLGEAGYGKTYESIDLLSKVCSDSRASNLIPFYLPLHEYGRIYSSIMDGIIYKLKPFYEGDPENIVTKWFANGQAVLILDGIDDIQTMELRDKFIAEAKNIALHYELPYLFITSRFNRYHDELGNINKLFLRGLDHEIIRQQLHKENIYAKIPNSYYQLFENPMLFDVGKRVLKRSNHRELFNRSILFEELTLMLCGEWDKKKGISTANALSYSEVIGLLGNYAFDKFNQASSSLLEFDQYISNSIHAVNKSLIINALLGSGILKVSDRITFVHKLFKEYCTAYHLVHKYTLSDYNSAYLELINKDEWKEVFVFAAGMFIDIDCQDIYLDFIMKHNLPIYIECINAKSDLSAQLPSPSSEVFVKRYLGQIIKTYTYIIDTYFAPIRFNFDPAPRNAEEKIAEKKIRIIGSISNDGTNLTYWFDRAMPHEEDVLCINDNQIENYSECHREQAILERKKIITYGIDLKASGRDGDSGRKIAIDLIKKGIKSILEQKNLNESEYLLCERLDDCKRKLKGIKNLSDIAEAHTIVEDMINKVVEKHTNLVSYVCDGVDMFYLHSLLDIIINNAIDFNDCILPKEDVSPSESTLWTWDLYSDNQKANRLMKYFYFHQLSYLEMIMSNFPSLFQRFTRYQDIPYQTIVLVYLKEDKEKDIHSEPSITYYYVASPVDYPALPQLRYVNNEAEYEEQKKNIYDEIKQSYYKIGKEIHRLSFTQTGFMYTTRSRKTNEKRPLSDYVYDSIKDSLEEILGKL